MYGGGGGVRVFYISCFYVSVGVLFLFVCAFMRVSIFFRLLTPVIIVFPGSHRHQEGTQRTDSKGRFDRYYFYGTLP